MKREEADKIKQLIEVHFPEITSDTKASLYFWIEEQIPQDKIHFTDFWQLYPKKTGRKITQDCWNKLTFAKQKLAITYLTNYIARAGGFIHDPVRYLKYEMYLDFYYEHVARTKKSNVKNELFEEECGK